MKIALLTIWHEKNFGAEMQAYATIKTLRQLGHDVEMMNIRLSDCKRPNWKGRLGNLLSCFSPSRQVFDRFWCKYIPAGKRYRSLKAIQSAPPEADVYMVGSDQVWNPDITGDFATLYFLDFGPVSVRRVSYASSFGTDTWKHPELKEQVQSLLDRFQALTCREQAGVAILHDTFNIEARTVLDPTLLPENYDELTGLIQEKPVLAFYPLHTDPELEEYAHNIADRLGIQAVNINETEYILKGIPWKRPSPEDWIGGIAGAQFVLTRSFHGMTMSLLHKRQFAVVSSPNGRNSRLTGLLEQLGLSDRFFTSFEELMQARPWESPIDYENITPRLRRLRAESLEVLKSML